MERKWWKEGVIYQIYPQSFMDTNGDGIGDLEGIIQKLDYVKSLGVDIIWLNPIYDSPLDDNGYDIRDYRMINPIYGDLETFERLLEEAHQRGLRIIMDLVVNHSSDEHAWFVESRKSRDNAYRDYYYWHPGSNGGPPNNWPAFFGGSVWEFDEATGEYYLHYFSKKQPDLNWENPKVVQEIYDLVNWWLEKGIDGFRLDVISMISKHLDFPQTEGMDFVDLFQKYYCNGPRVHEFIHGLYENTTSRYDVMTVGEGPGISKELANLYTGKDRGELDMIFPLDLMFYDWGPGGKFDPQERSVIALKKFFREWDEALGDDGWMSVFLDNHDFARMLSRFGNDREFRTESAKLLVTLLMTLRGTPCIHYGSEIGMSNATWNSLEECRDIEALNFFHEALNQGMPEEEILQRINDVSRDNVRTPMQWNASSNAGFTTGQPWIKCNENLTTVNVENEESDDNGILAYYRRMISFRKSNLVFTYGKFSDLDPDHRQVFAYQREGGEALFAVYLNFSDSEVSYPIDESELSLVLCNYDGDRQSGVLSPWEARVYRTK